MGDTVEILTANLKNSDPLIASYGTNSLGLGVLYCVLRTEKRFAGLRASLFTPVGLGQLDVHGSSAPPSLRTAC